MQGMQGMPAGWTRRDFLMRFGTAAGSGAMYRAMGAMGLMAIPQAYAGAPKLATDSGRGLSVVIIGAGIGGLTAAYELGKAGYKCTLLEASGRAGGRNRTVRRGDTIREIDSEQVCDFDDEPHLYFNAGPARLPYHHVAILDYCRQFEVALEPFVNDNRGSYFHSTRAFGGKPIRGETIQTDTRGHLAELLAKASNKHALDDVMTADDAEMLRAMLKQWGDLDKDLLYKGSSRGGHIGDEILQAGQPRPPIDLHELLRSDFWQFQMEFAEGWEQHPTMMQPVGGMDGIVKGFVKAIGDGVILRNAPVTKLVNGDKNVRVTYLQDGKPHEIDADFCVNGAPAWLIKKLDHNFSRDYREALDKVHAAKLFKIAFQGKRRFWEEDDHIYGGISWTDQDILQMWYPPHGFHKKKGITLASYTWDPGKGEAWGRLTPAQRLTSAIQQAEKIHPGYGGMVEKGMSIAWAKIPYQMGCAPEWEDADRAVHFKRLQQPDRRHYLVGDQMSYVTGWQEGAVRSAHAVIEHIQQRVATTT
ncbi:MAG: twin-arginine translocation pathway signal protein [Hydrocarboniphaga sp.]|uniref:flavin monoamine oxidase family protein n=1 Tax=Hydrocarboniphaga sp. TaxID=2033016 RepID=UPI002636D4F1|nr:FAD-dependent oxidoreductase [Hydrocarboniphaga sp.]MDB5967641.1 twin-arginine translocation pathway signal protein [Hydrocarboniphaga sp.]